MLADGVVWVASLGRQLRRDGWPCTTGDPRGAARGQLVDVNLGRGPLARLMEANRLSYEPARGDPGGRSRDPVGDD